MKNKTETLHDLWQEARTRFTNQLPGITPEDLPRKLPPAPNSLGFLIRHIGDVELLFAKNVFGAADLKVSAKTIIARHDTGQWTDLEELKAYVSYSGQVLRAIIEKQSEQDWQIPVTTPEFGTKTKAEALGRIISHTAYHAGQLVLLHKYGQA